MTNDIEKMREAIVKAHTQIQNEYITNESLVTNEQWVALSGKIEILDLIANELLDSDDKLISEIGDTKKIITGKQKNNQ